MIPVWFGIVCTMLVIFAVLEGWDFGAGALHLIVARTAAERREVIAAIGPLWIWHEVWLVGAGGTFMVAFPKAMAVAFSGFYLALWLALWSFMLRGISIEVAGHLGDPLWQSFWDFVFAVSNFLLALVFGAALGNVIRGVPLDEQGVFSLSFFTDFGVRGRVGILDWYTLSAAVVTMLVVTAHGATFLMHKTLGPVHSRSRRWANGLWVAAAAGLPLLAVETWYVRPEMVSAIAGRPLGDLGLLIVVGGAGTLWTGLRAKREERAFLGSCLLLGGLLGVLAVGLYPVLLRSTIAPEFSVTAQQAASGPSGLALALEWWPIAFVLALGYLAYVARQFRGKVRPSADTQGYSS